MILININFTFTMRLQLLKEEFSIDQLKKIKEFQKESFVNILF